MSTPFFGPNNDQILRQIEEQRRQRQQQVVQPPQASAPPPTDVATQADAALFAAQQLASQKQQANLRREEEAAQAGSLLDTADRYEQNAQLAQQAAQESVQLAQQQRAQADQLAQLHQQEAAQEDQALSQANEVAAQAEVQRVIRDPQVVAQVKPDLAQALNVDPKAIDAEVERTFLEAQGIFSGQLDRNNARQVALAEKIQSGKNFSSKEKLALGMMALLPVIVGAARGNLGQGLVAAGKAITGFSAIKQQELEKNQAEQRFLEDRELGLAKGKLDNVGKYTSIKSNVNDIQLRQIGALEDSERHQLQAQGLKMENVSRLEKAQQMKLMTREKLLEFDEKLKKIESGENISESGKISGDQRKAATFGVRMEQAEDIFGVLEKEAFSPVEGEGFLVNRLKSGERQRYDQAKRNFVNAVLRRESGAAISEGEFASAEEQYFPQPGDAPEVLAQKRVNRATVIAGLKAEAGSTAVKDVYRELGKLKPVTQVERDVSQETDLSKLSDEELRRIIEGGQ